MKPTVQAKWWRRRAVGLGVLLCVAIALLMVMWRSAPSEPERVRILRELTAVPLAMRDRFTMALGPNRPWVARAEQALFGQRKAIHVSADVFEFAATELTNLQTSLALGPAVYRDNAGLKIWFVPNAQLTNVIDKIGRFPGGQVLRQPHIETAEGITSSVFSGVQMRINGKPKDVGFSFSIAPQFERDATQLLTTVLQTELISTPPAEQSGSNETQTVSIRTNIAFTADLIIPIRSGVVVINSSKESADRVFGLVIRPVR